MVRRKGFRQTVASGVKKQRPTRSDPESSRIEWSSDQRSQVLRLITTATKGLSWSPSLLRLLLDELFVDESFTELMGEPRTLRLRRYPQAVALAIALRHSWRSDDLADVARRLGVDLSFATPKASATMRASRAPRLVRR